MSFRTNLQALRSQRNMTQEQLAMLVGVSRQSVSKWESDKAYPEMDKLLAICDLFGCTLDDLVLGDVRRPGSGRYDDPKPQDLAGRDDGAPNRPEAISRCSPVRPTAPVPSTMEEVTGYASFSKVYSLRRAFGFAAILLGLAFSGLFAGGATRRTHRTVWPSSS